MMAPSAASRATESSRTRPLVSLAIQQSAEVNPAMRSDGPIAQQAFAQPTTRKNDRNTAKTVAKIRSDLIENCHGMRQAPVPADGLRPFVFQDLPLDFLAVGADIRPGVGEVLGPQGRVVPQ